MAASRLDRLVSDLQDAGLSAPASEIRSPAVAVWEEIVAIDVEGTSADEITASFDGQTRALRRIREVFSRWERRSVVCAERSSNGLDELR